MGKNLSNKECLRKMLEMMEGEDMRNGASQKRGRENGMMAGRGNALRIEAKKLQSQPQAKKPLKIPGEKIRTRGQTLESSKVSVKKSEPRMKKITRYIPVQQKQHLSEKCEHPNCHRPATIIHHTKRFSTHRTHENLKHLCKQHHEFAHNGISEPMQLADYNYRKFRQMAMRM